MEPTRSTSTASQTDSGEGAADAPVNGPVAREHDSPSPPTTSNATGEGQAAAFADQGLVGTEAPLGADGASEDQSRSGEPLGPPEIVPPEPSGLRYWMRPILLGIGVIVLLGLTLWDSRRVPVRPAPPAVLIATPVAGAAGMIEPALDDAISRLRTAMGRRDASTMGTLADPAGVVVATYSGALPESGPIVTDPHRLAQEAFSGSQVTVLGWRNDGRGRVVLLTDGWPRRTLRLAPGSVLEMTSLTAIGIAEENGVWRWRWFMTDGQGALIQQARNTPWRSPAEIDARPTGRTGS